MNRIYKTLLLFILSISFVISSAVVASAAGTVTYEGEAKKFIFEPGSKYSPTDLFTDFKGVMPGDSITQQVYIDNNVANNVKVKIYMRALGPTPDTEEFVSEEANVAFLSQLDLRVAVQDGEELFKAHANETDGLTDWYCLGTFYSGAAVTLDVTLDVPLTMGNEFQNAIGLLDWEFAVEEFPVEPDDPTPPTGDSDSYVYFIIAACVCVGVVFFLLFFKRKKNDDDDDE